MTIVARGITVKKRPRKAQEHVEKQSRSSISLLRATIESFAYGVLAVNAEGKITILNQRFADMFQIPNAVTHVRDVSEMLAFVVDKVKLPCEWLTKVKSHGHPDMECSDFLEFKDGRVFEAHCYPQRIAGKVAGKVWSFRNATEEKIAEKEVLENKQRFEALFMGNPGATVYLSSDFHILNMNPRFLELFGYSLEEVRNKHINDVIVPNGRIGEAQILDQQAAIDCVYFDTERKRKDGSFVPVSVSAAPVIVEGKPVGHIAMYKDISELKRTEAAMKEMMQKLSTINEKLRVVGSLTRHDVRNKLSIVTGNVYLAKRRLHDNPEVTGYLQDVNSACEQITDIFDFDHNYEMLGVEELKSTDVSETLGKAVSLFLDMKGIRVVNECLGLKVLADSLLVSLFYNLVDNSLKYGKKITQIKVYHEKVHNGQLELIYQDDGVGIPHKEKSNLFKEGYGKGTGYGLYLIKKMMEVYGWTIKETGEPGIGAQFTISIPEKNQNGKKSYQVS